MILMISLSNKYYRLRIDWCMDWWLLLILIKRIPNDIVLIPRWNIYYLFSIDFIHILRSFKMYRPWENHDGNHWFYTVLLKTENFFIKKRKCLFYQYHTFGKIKVDFSFVYKYVLGCFFYQPMHYKSLSNVCK